MRTIRDMDSSYKGGCQLMVQNVQLLADQLKLTSLMVTVWEYQLSQGNPFFISYHFRFIFILFIFQFCQFEETFLKGACEPNVDLVKNCTKGIDLI